MQNIQEFLSVNTHLYKNNEATMPWGLAQVMCI
jgi:hypothetical protein